MKLQFKSSPTIVSEDMPVSTMGMRVERMGMAAQLLRDQTYKDKVLAIVREYTTNAIDTSIEHNIQEPVIVKIGRVDGRDMWSVRDYSIGLDEHDIRNVFGMYFESTKAHSNLFVGCMGIGSKCALAYSDTFYVTSYHNGTKTQYSCMLGGCDESGYPKGEIYKIHEEPTTETGLEVSVDITGDTYVFSNTTRKFVENFLPDVKLEYHNGPTVHKPLIPIMSKTMGDFTIHQYDTSFDSDGRYCSYRMGGVVYKRDGRYINNTKNKIVVDIPIGKLSVITSREDFEDTPKNTKVFGEISDAIDKLMDEDKASITVPKFGSDVIGNSSYSLKTYSCDWFDYAFSKVFPDTINFQNRLYQENYTRVITPINGKYVIYLIPDIKSYRNWVKRLMIFANTVTPNTRVLWTLKPHNGIIPQSTDTLDLSDISFVDVKALGLPKLPTNSSQTEYLVYKNGYRKGAFSPDNLEEEVSTKYFNDDDIAPDWYTNVKSKDILHSRTIGVTSEVGTSNNFWTCNSKKMKSDLVELGWLDNNSQAYKDKLSELNKIERAEAERNNAAYRAKEILFRIAPSKRTITSIANKPTNITRIEAIKSKILKEDSPRARILHSVTGYYPKMTREDLRKILNMK